MLIFFSVVFLDMFSGFELGETLIAIGDFFYVLRDVFLNGCTNLFIQVIQIVHVLTIQLKVVYLGVCYYALRSGAFWQRHPALL